MWDYTMVNRGKSFSIANWSSCWRVWVATNAAMAAWLSGANMAMMCEAFRPTAAPSAAAKCGSSAATATRPSAQG